MDLFNTELPSNMLPFDGVVNYYGKVVKQREAGEYLDRLLNNIEWKNDEAIILVSILSLKEKLRGMEMPTIHTLIQTPLNKH